MEEALYDMALFREFVGLDAGEDNLPGSRRTRRSSQPRSPQAPQLGAIDGHRLRELTRICLRRAADCAVGRDVHMRLEGVAAAKPVREKRLALRLWRHIEVEAVGEAQRIFPFHWELGIPMPRAVVVPNPTVFRTPWRVLEPIHPPTVSVREFGDSLRGCFQVSAIVVALG